RARIETRPAANALQALAERRRQYLGPAIVQNDQVKFFGTILFAVAPGPGDQGRVDRESLSSGSPRQQLEKNRQINQPWNDFFHTHDRDVDARAGRRKSAVAFIGDE